MSKHERLTGQHDDDCEPGTTLHWNIEGITCYENQHQTTSCRRVGSTERSGLQPARAMTPRRPPHRQPALMSSGQSLAPYASLDPGEGRRIQHGHHGLHVERRRGRDGRSLREYNAVRRHHRPIHPEVFDLRAGNERRDESSASSFSFRTPRFRRHRLLRSCSGRSISRTTSSACGRCTSGRTAPTRSGLFPRRGILECTVELFVVPRSEALLSSRGAKRRGI